jgi:hypothetical protein
VSQPDDNANLPKERNILRHEAMTHLLHLMRHGWAAKEQTNAH